MLRTSGRRHVLAPSASTTLTPWKIRYQLCSSSHGVSRKIGTWLGYG